LVIVMGSIRRQRGCLAEFVWQGIRSKWGRFGTDGWRGCAPSSFGSFLSMRIADRPLIPLDYRKMAISPREIWPCRIKDGRLYLDLLNQALRAVLLTTWRVFTNGYKDFSQQ
jgi:hypothetical protein